MQVQGSQSGEATQERRASAKPQTGSKGAWLKPLHTGEMKILHGVAREFMRPVGLCDASGEPRRLDHLKANVVLP
jgi:hypothetical protein